MSMLINPYRFGPVGAPSDWQTLTDGVFTGFSNSWQNFTVRTFLSRSALPAGATKVRVTFGASSSSGLKIAKAYVGRSRLSVFDVAPTQIFFGGNPDITIAAANGTVLSDEVALDYDGTTDLCISFYVPSDAAPLNTMGSRANSLFIGSRWQGGDLATTTGVTLNSGGTVQGIRKVEVFTGGTWKNIFLSHSDYPTNWNGHTIRGLYSVGHFSRSRPIVRFGIACRVTDMFVGNSAEGANPFDFLSTPTRLTFGGANGTGTEDFRVYMTDDFDFTTLDVTKPLLVSYHSATTRIAARSSPPSGQSSRFKGGNSASSVSWQSGSSSWGQFLGPQIIDEKY